jgi:hypothetical protein
LAILKVILRRVRSKVSMSPRDGFEAIGKFLVRQHAGEHGRHDLGRHDTASGLRFGSPALTISAPVAIFSVMKFLFALVGEQEQKDGPGIRAGLV